MAIVIDNENLSFGLGSVSVFKFGGKERHTTVNPEETGSSGKVALWGEDNRYPQNFMATLKKNGAGGSSYRFLKAAHYGQGFKLYQPDSNVDGKENKKVVPINSIEPINNFFKKRKMHRVFTEIISDLENFNIGWPEFILTNDYKEVDSVRRLQTAKMRYEKINPKTGLIENSYFCHNWQRNTDVESQYVSKIPVVDSYCSAEEVMEHCRSKKIHKFTMPIFYPLVDETYYPEADHHSVYRNGWMQVVNDIPEYKKHFSENQLNIKYMVYISENYFTTTYKGEWEKYSIDKKTQIRKELTQAIDDHLSGNKNAGKSIQSTVFYDNASQKFVKGIEVVPLKDENSSEGKGLLDSSAGNSEIMSAIGTDPNLMGVGIPGGKLNGGSGSDKREAFSIMNAQFKTKRETTLEIWRFLRDYNQWPAELEGDFAITELTTLDANPTGSQTKF